MSRTLSELEALSRRSRDPCLVDPASATVGGVDPLGLRQINFDLMNRVFPGLNNVARHVRPFTIVTWAWRRTIALARQRKLKLPISTHEDFVARIEVAFVWSMLQREDGADVDLPGKQRIARMWGDAKRIRFGDDEWRRFVKARRNSTALTAAVNYGPGLRALGFQHDDPGQPGVRVHAGGTERMLDAFEGRLQPILGHRLFRGWDECVLTRRDAAAWLELWDMEDLLDEERVAMRERLLGERAPFHRRGGFELLEEVLEDWNEDPDEEEARLAMCEVDAATLDTPALLWLRVQVRQAFRLALEALLEWIVIELGGSILSTAALAERLLTEVGAERAGTARAWLASLHPDDPSPVRAIGELQASFAARTGLGRAIFSALSVAIFSPVEFHDGSERRERLPIGEAAREFRVIEGESEASFVGHVIERWVIAQHTYWSVGRGLADARAGAKSILRLRLVLEPTGWRVTRGRGSRGMPRPTPDRLRTAISLAQEARLLTRG